MAEYTMIRPQDVRIAPCKNAIIDVRTPTEYVAKRLKAPHFFVPLDTLKPAEFILRHGLDADTNLYFLCASGGRAKKAAQLCADAGLHHVYVIEGGLNAWEQAGAPIEGTQLASGVPQVAGGITMERQVRIAAGGIVALATVCGYLLHPIFYLIALFLGCGLVYSGITNNCGMALLLAKAPWNKATGCGGAGQACSVGGAGKGPGSSSGQSCQ